MQFKVIIPWSTVLHVWLWTSSYINKLHKKWRGKNNEMFNISIVPDSCHFLNVNPRKNYKLIKKWKYKQKTCLWMGNFNEILTLIKCCKDKQMYYVSLYSNWKKCVHLSILSFQDVGKCQKIFRGTVKWVMRAMWVLGGREGGRGAVCICRPILPSGMLSISNIY